MGEDCSYYFKKLIELIREYADSAGEASKYNHACDYHEDPEACSWARKYEKHLDETWSIIERYAEYIGEKCLRE